MSAYKLGFNGHAKACDCTPCAKSRAAEIVDSARAHGVEFSSVTQTVFVKQYVVRSHMRRNKRHFNKKPNSSKELRNLIRSIMTLEATVTNLRKGKRNVR